MTLKKMPKPSLRRPSSPKNRNTPVTIRDGLNRKLRESIESEIQKFGRKEAIFGGVRGEDRRSELQILCREISEILRADQTQDPAEVIRKAVEYLLQFDNPQLTANELEAIRSASNRLKQASAEFSELLNHPAMINLIEGFVAQARGELSAVEKSCDTINLVLKTLEEFPNFRRMHAPIEANALPPIGAYFSWKILKVLRFEKNTTLSFENERLYPNPKNILRILAKILGRSIDEKNLERIIYDAGPKEQKLFLDNGGNFSAKKNKA